MALKEKVENFSERQEVLTVLMESKDKRAEDSTREVSGEDLQGVEGAGGAEHTRSAGTRTKAQADQVGRVKGRGQGLCKGWMRQEQ